jgi:hypothetical protein
MRRPRTITLVIMGGGLATLGAVTLGATSGRSCQPPPAQPGAPPANDTACQHSSGGSGYIGTGSSGSGSGSQASTSARGGFGASGSAHGGE